MKLHESSQISPNVEKIHSKRDLENIFQRTGQSLRIFHSMDVKNLLSEVSTNCRSTLVLVQTNWIRPRTSITKFGL